MFCLQPLASGKAELEQAVARVKKTRRPRLEALADLARDAAALPCQPADERELSQLITSFATWQVGPGPTTGNVVASRPWVHDVGSDH